MQTIFVIAYWTITTLLMTFGMYRSDNNGELTLHTLLCSIMFGWLLIPFFILIFVAENADKVIIFKKKNNG